MLLVGFESTIVVGEQPQTNALDRPANGTEKENTFTTTHSNYILFISKYQYQELWLTNRHNE
jgi:hypothetical protein